MLNCISDNCYIRDSLSRFSFGLVLQHSSNQTAGSGVLGVGLPQPLLVQTHVQSVLLRHQRQGQRGGEEQNQTAPDVRGGINE